MNFKLTACAAMLGLSALSFGPCSAQAEESSSTPPVHQATHHRATAAAKKTTAAKVAKVKKPRKVTPKMQAARDRMHQCGAEWKRDKAAGHTKGTTWPKYWHQCSVRLKAKA